MEIKEELNEIYRLIVGGPAKENASKDREKNDLERIEKFYNYLITLDTENVVIFTHGNVIRYILSKFLNMSSKDTWSRLVISPGSVSIIERINKGFQVKAINMYGHQSKEINEFLSGKIKSESYLS